MCLTTKPARVYLANPSTPNISINTISVKEILFNNFEKSEVSINFISTEIIDDGKFVIYHFDIPTTENDRICKQCGAKSHINRRYKITLKHGNYLGVEQRICFTRIQYHCPKCGSTHIQEIPFRDIEHRITSHLRRYIEDLLSENTFTYCQISKLTGVDKNIIIDINEKRLKNLYTVDGKSLKQPESPAKFLAVDEFLLHKGKKYATIIIDQETGHVLWVAKGKKKQVVYDFIEHVGLSWMKNVKAVACDMNSDFEEAFREKCPHVLIVNDHFHIVKFLNDNVIDPIRKALQKELKEKNDNAGIETLKRSKFLLKSNVATLLKKDEEATKGKVLQKSSNLFKINEVRAKSDHLKRYTDLKQKFPIFQEIEDVKYDLQDMYMESEKSIVEAYFNTIVDRCQTSGNKYLEKFGNLLSRHQDGVVNHGIYPISSGRIEGINQRIKTMRRSSYGLPNDQRFFLRLLDLRPVI